MAEPPPLRLARLFHHRQGGRTVALGDNIEPFDALDLVPGERHHCPGSHSWITLPLFYRSENLGYLVAELDGTDGIYYEALRVHLSATVWALRREALACLA